ncbi:MAG TPA: FkbM family methyltransferase [Chryseolinea sp.]|nr:FkbM family methyltransferase [Chryseolinea sp.]
MNNFKKFVHRSVLKTNLEEFFISLRKRINYIRKFIPLSIRHKFGSVGKFVPQAESYPPDDNYLVIRDGTYFRINRSDYVQWRIFYGVRDNSLMWARKLVKPNSIVLDIGANVGSFSLRLASYVIREKINTVYIHTFEPNPFVVRNLMENLSLNPGISDIVKIHPIGLGNEKGKLPLIYNNSNTGAGRITSDVQEETISIEIDCVDDVVATINPHNISFIKMIVEGFEPHVFKGAVKTIEKYKPPIFFEVTPAWYSEMGSSLSEILAQLTALGYSYYGELHNEMIPYDPKVFDDLDQFNLFAVAKD